MVLMKWAVFYDSDVQPIPMKAFDDEAAARQWLEDFRRKELADAKARMTTLGIKRTRKRLAEDYYVAHKSIEDIVLLDAGWLDMKELS